MPTGVSGKFNCERCDSDENVKMMDLFGEGEPDGEERLCWDCRWPYIEARVHPERYPEMKGAPSSDVDPDAFENAPEWSATFADFYPIRSSASRRSS